MRPEMQSAKKARALEAKVRAGAEGDDLRKLEEKLKALLEERTKLYQALEDDRYRLANPGEGPKMNISMKVVVVLGLLNVEWLAVYVLYKGAKAYIRHRKLSAAEAFAKASETAHTAQVAANEGNTEQLQKLKDVVPVVEKQAKDAMGRFESLIEDPKKVVTVAAGQTPKAAVEAELGRQCDEARDLAVQVVRPYAEAICKDLEDSGVGNLAANGRLMLRARGAAVDSPAAGPLASATRRQIDGIAARLLEGGDLAVQV